LKPDANVFKQRLYPNLLEAVIQCTRQIFFEKKYADKAIEKMLQSNSRWGARDRAFIAEYTYDMVRWWRLLQYIANVPENETGVRMHHLFAALWVWNGHELPEWQEFKGFDKNRMEILFAQSENIRKIRESIPDWLDILGERELGPSWDDEIRALNEQAGTYCTCQYLKDLSKRFVKIVE
jgi:16S rRNA (cytosine967-C5)-methyltransferase